MQKKYNRICLFAMIIAIITVVANAFPVIIYSEMGYYGYETSAFTGFQALAFYSDFASEVEDVLMGLISVMMLIVGIVTLCFSAIFFSNARKSRDVATAAGYAKKTLIFAILDIVALSLYLLEGFIICIMMTSYNYFKSPFTFAFMPTFAGIGLFVPYCIFRRNAQNSPAAVGGGAELTSPGTNNVEPVRQFSEIENYAANLMAVPTDNKVLLAKINVPKDYRKRTTLASNLYYDTLEIYRNRVVGYFEGEQRMTWFFKNYIGLDFIGANLNSQFAQIVFLTGMNSRNRVVGLDLYGVQNAQAMNDTNRILFCNGMTSFATTNEFGRQVYDVVHKWFDDYKNSGDEVQPAAAAVRPQITAADELKKFKELLDIGAITQEEFDAKKKELLGL